MVRNQICLYQNPNTHLLVNYCGYLPFLDGLFVKPSVEKEKKRKAGKVSKFGKREIPVCVIGAIKSKCGFLDFEPAWPCKMLGKTEYGIYKIQSGIKAKSTLGKIILNPWLENIGFPHNVHAISIYISSLEISQFFQCRLFQVAPFSHCGLNTYKYCGRNGWIAEEDSPGGPGSPRWS